MVKAYWDKIGCYLKENERQENVLFLEDYLWISNLISINVKKFKKENVDTKTPLECLSLGDLKNKNYILFPRNNLSSIKLNLRDMSCIFKNKINVTNFKSLSLKTKIDIKLFSMNDLTELNKLKEYIPEHSELAIEYSHTKIKF